MQSESDTPTDRDATFALIDSLIEASTEQETELTLGRVRELAAALLSSDVSVQTLVEEELRIAD